MSVHWTNVGELLESRAANDPRIVAADRRSGSLQAAVTRSRSHSVTGSSCDSRAPSRHSVRLPLLEALQRARPIKIILSYAGCLLELAGLWARYRSCR